MSQIPMISIVDDDESVCSALTGLIRSLGYTAHGFHSAEDFLQSAHVDEFLHYSTVMCIATYALLARFSKPYPKASARLLHN